MTLRNSAISAASPNIKSLFAIDLRSLAFFRIGLGLILLVDLSTRAQDLGAHYTGAGILPLNPLQATFSRWYYFSLHYLNDALWFQGLLFILAALAALALLVGFHTRLATFLSWIFLLSLQARNPLVLQFGDVVLRVLLFWALFLPLGAMFSVDQRRRPRDFPQPPSVLSAGSVALLLQVVFIYLFTALLKTGPDWWAEGTAVYYALNLETLATDLGLYLGSFPKLCLLLTYAALLLELLGPLLVFIPWQTGKIRTVIVLSFWTFHLGLALTLYLGIFPWACMIAWIVFLPSGFWEFLAKKFQRTKSAAEELTMGIPTKPLSSPWWVQVIAGTLIFYVFFWNLRTAYFERVSPYFPKALNSIGEVLRLEQRWGMYVPQPTKIGGWYVIPGTLVNGQEIDLHRGGQALTWEKPPQVAKSFGGDRWGNYLTWIWDPDYKAYRPAFAEYLCRHWNKNQSPDRILEKISIFQIRQATLPDYQRTKPEQIQLYETKC